MYEDINYVLFDCWDTLVKTKYKEKNVEATFFYQFIVNKDKIPFDLYEKEFTSILFNYFSSSYFEMEDDAIFNYLQVKLDLVFDRPYEEIRKLYHNMFEMTKIEGIDEFLDLLEERNIRYSVLSNAFYHEDIGKRIIEVNFPNRKFEKIYVSSRFVVKKPSPLFFNIAINELKLDPRHTLYIGDNIKADVLGSHSANLVPIYLNWKNKSIKPEEKDLYNFDYLEVSSYYELCEKFKESIK